MQVSYSTIIELWCVLLIMITHDAHACYPVHKRETADDENALEKSNLIFPGTLWCGPGNLAETEEDLGQFNNTDACCRTHDNCPDVIEAGGSKQGLTNNASYTRVHCSCDEAFYSCLKEVDSVPSREVGQIYFNILDTQCFREDYPIVSCRRYSSIVRWRCEEYNLDEQADMQWQWFDVPIY